MLGVVAVLAVTPRAEAQQGDAPAAEAKPPVGAARDWGFELNPYLWLTMIDGEVDPARFRNRHIKADRGDVLEAFDVGMMGSASVRWKLFLFLTDVAWSRLSDRDPLRDTQVRYELEQEIGWLEALAGYRVYQKPGPPRFQRGVGGFGAGHAPDVAWQAHGLLSYRLTDPLRLSAGYRGQGLEKHNVTLNLHGPVLGASIRY